MLIVESSTFMQKTFIFDNVLCLSKEIKDMLIVKLNCRVFHLYAKKLYQRFFDTKNIPILNFIYVALKTISK